MERFRQLGRFHRPNRTLAQTIGRKGGESFLRCVGDGHSAVTTNSSYQELLLSAAAYDLHFLRGTQHLSTWVRRCLGMYFGVSQATQSQLEP